MKMRLLLFSLGAGMLASGATQAQTPQKRYEPISFSQVNITDQFWRPKLDKVATATLQACILQTEQKTGRIRNFEKVKRASVPGNKPEKHEGIYYDDSDVYKALEAIAYSLKNRPDAELEKKADEWIDKIADAQQPDGYLNTYFTLMAPSQRWTDMEKHETYCAGHLIEAAVAYYNTTGKRKLLDVAIRFADHIDTTFRQAGRHWVSGHQEIELALMKLYHQTQNNRYLKLADWFLDQRGHNHGVGGIWEHAGPAYCQDDVPVKEQKEITGHAVRAMYLYTGAADVAASTQDPGYMNAMKTVWEDVVYRNMYITGGIGSSGSNEGFSTDYDLPNQSAYCETCASVGMVFWNQRMNLLTGDAKYFDVLERSLYNGALSGLSLTGDRFFYGNPLASSGTHARREWFGTACCPSNIARLVASLGDYIYGKDQSGIWVNLYVGSNTTVTLEKTSVPIRMETSYPWEGTVKLTMNPEKKTTYSLRLRIPGWASNAVVPGDLYRFSEKYSSNVSLQVNGKAAEFRTENGYAVITRTWQKGDVVELTLPMEVKRVLAKAEVSANSDRIALQRGPLVYCVEGADNDGQAWNLIVPPSATFKAVPHRVSTEQVVAIQAMLPVVGPSSDGTQLVTRNNMVTAIPYYAWANRGSNPMQVWLPVKFRQIKLSE